MAVSTGRRPLTPQQRAAIDTRHVSIALSAGAGCGKTFVLTERFLSHLDPSIEPAVPGGAGPARLENLIAITFTRRAAREMRERIRGACHDRLIGSESPEEVHHWLTLVRGLQRARISTIDSFCADFLRAHAVEAGIDPAFRVLDAAQSASLLTESIDTQLRRLLLDGDEALVALAVDYGLAAIRDMLRNLLARSREPLDFDAWQYRTPDELVAVWSDYRIEVCLPLLVERLQTDPKVQGLFTLLASIESDNPLLQQRQGALLEAWRDLGPERLAARAAELVEHARVTGKGVIPALKQLEIYDQVKQGFEDLRKAANGILAKLPWEPEVARRAAEAGLRLLRVAGQAQAAYAERKRAESAVDFRDLVAKTRELLLDGQHDELRQRLSGDIRILLVDEFQDTDPLQAELIEALCGEELTKGKLFFVGDFKQSIYRFRGADPSVFARLRSRTAREGQLPLSENFRSQPAILNFVNGLFAAQLGTDYEPLRPHRPQVSPEPAVEFLWATAAEGEADNPRALREREADWLARRIRQLIDSQAEIVWDQAAADAGHPAARAVRPGDVAILFRALSDVQFYESALRRYGLEYYLVGGHAFYSQQEVFDLLNLLRALTSPADAVSLAGVLRSPFFALDDETLFWLGQHPQGLRAGLADAANRVNLSADQQARVEFAQQVLATLRDCKDRLPVAALIERSLALTGYDALLLTEYLGTRKLANLRKLIEQARSFDSAGICTLAEFVTQLDEFVSRQPEEAMAATEPEASDVIRLMTIHQSKGLEFPIVAVPDLQRSAHANTGAVFSQRLGPLVKLPAELEPGRELTGRDLYAIVESDQDRAESARLFYVATTRAADYLLLSSGVKQIGEATSPWLRLLANRFDLLDGRFSGATPSTSQPRVQVTTAPPELAENATARRAAVDLAGALAAAERLASQRPLPVPAGVAPIPVDRSGRRQFSFSELDAALRHSATDLDGEWQVPHDGEPRSMAEAQLLGTLVHALLADLPRNPRLALEERALHLWQLMGEAARSSAVASEKVLRTATDLARRFQESPRCAGLQSAAQVHTEIEFLLAWPPAGNGGDGIYFRGFIDCLYCDQAGLWHVLDYKTNRVTAPRVAEVARPYHPQMLLYALAVEQALGEPPASLTLSFLEPGVEVEVPYSAAARGEAITAIEAALAAFRLGESTAS